MLRRFPIRQNDSKGKSAKQAVAPIPVVIETCKGYPTKRSFLADSFLDCFLVAVEYFQEESLRVLTGLEPVKKGAC